MFWEILTKGSFAFTFLSCSYLVGVKFWIFHDMKPTILFSSFLFSLMPVPLTRHRAEGFTWCSKMLC